MLFTAFCSGCAWGRDTEEGGRQVESEKEGKNGFMSVAISLRYKSKNN